MYDKEEVRRFLTERVARPSSAGIIIENSAGEALVLKAHYKEYWSFPGGWVENGQTPRQAAIRELLEETGITVEEEFLVFSFVVDRKSSIMQTYQFIFKSSNPYDTSAQITLQSDEIDAYAFVSRDTVNATPDEYGGAVIAWAHDASAGYFEQTLGL